MGAQGSTTGNFGSFPGGDQASVAVTGQTGILSTSLCEAWIDPTQTATSDHTQDEHVAADIDVRCEAIVAGTGFNIILRARGAPQYGAWSVSWVWN